MQDAWIYTNRNRTFGFEFEVADVEKQKIVLPTGYSWSKDETIINTDGRIVKSSSLYGGELNTRPFVLTQQDRAEIKDVLTQMFLFGGKCTWCHGFAVHIYAGDFSIEALKNVFLLSYHTAQYIKQWADVGGWSEYSNQAPTPTLEFAQKLRNATNFAEIENVFANSSVKGYIRHLVNITSYFKHQTIEFRIFNPTYNLEEIEASVLFAFRFVEYAATHKEEDFEKITSLEDFCRELKLRRPLAKKLEPLIYSGDQSSEQDRYVSRVISVARGHIKVLLEQAGQELATINPNMYSVELSTYTKTALTIYNVDEFNHIIYLLATKALQITYLGNFAFLQDYNNDTPERQVACLLLFHRIRRFDSTSEYAIREMEAHKARAKESIERIEVTAKEIVQMFGNCKYVNGTVEDALCAEQNIFFQYENNSKTRATIPYLKKYSDYSLEYEHKSTNYYDMSKRIRAGQKFMMVSLNALLGFHKVGKIGKQIFYSNIIPDRAKLESKGEKGQFVYISVPPNDLEITDPKELRIVQVTPSEFSQVQKVYVKKVDKIQMSTFAFFVMYGKYCIGGFAFTWAKDSNYDIWLLSDFSTNNSIFRLAKLILLCVQTKFVKKVLQRKMRVAVDTTYTKVYTTNPVSMKYRGIFKKVKMDDPKKYLKYEAQLGVVKDEAEVMEMYNKMKNRNGK